MKESKSFDKQYANYLSQIKTIDFAKKTEILGIQKQEQLFVFDFFNRQIAFDGNDFIDMQGHAVTTAIKVMLCNYLLMCPDKILKASNRLVTFREFSNAGPLFSRFTENTGKIISTTFSGKMDKLKTWCRDLGGTIMETASYDLSVDFRALPRVSIILNFNDTDERMPANALFLLHDDAEMYLDLKSLTILCTYLTGLLLQAG